MRTLQKFSSVHDQVQNHFNLRPLQSFQNLLVFDERMFVNDQRIGTPVFHPLSVVWAADGSIPPTATHGLTLPKRPALLSTGALLPGAGSITTSAVFQRQSGTPPRIERNQLELHINMLQGRGPDRHRSGPRPNSRFHRNIKVLGGALRRCRTSGMLRLPLNAMHDLSNSRVIAQHRVSHEEPLIASDVLLSRGVADKIRRAISARSASKVRDHSGRNRAVNSCADGGRMSNMRRLHCLIQDIRHGLHHEGTSLRDSARKNDSRKRRASGNQALDDASRPETQ